MPTSDSASATAVAPLLRLAKGILIAVTVVYTIVLVCCLWILRSEGERFWVSSLLIYLPPQLWLLPLAVLLPAALALARWLLLPQLFCVFFVAVWFCGLHFSNVKPGDAKAITVVTNNIGQSNHLSMEPFLKETNPDVLVVQDARSRLAWYRRTHPDRYCAAAGEFITISRYPISLTRLVDRPQWRGPFAAVFRIEWPERPFLLYAVHMPTPRPDFLRLRGHGFLVSTIKSGGIPFAQIGDYKRSMEMRVQAAEAFSDLLANEKEPAIIAGDFNMPSWGYLHSVFASKLTDAFAVAGNGFGLTFPGFTRDPLTLFGPWLRIDYLFCNKDWKPVSCITEAHRGSQHRAVAATFEWNGH